MFSTVSLISFKLFSMSFFIVSCFAIKSSNFCFCSSLKSLTFSVNLFSNDFNDSLNSFLFSVPIESSCSESFLLFSSVLLTNLSRFPEKILNCSFSAFDCISKVFMRVSLNVLKEMLNSSLFSLKDFWFSLLFLSNSSRISVSKCFISFFISVNSSNVSELSSTVNFFLLTIIATMIIFIITAIVKIMSNIFVIIISNLFKLFLFY